MVLVICPFVTLATVERRDTYLPLLQKICDETRAKEPECLAYCWMKENTNSVDPTAKSVYVRGLEVYANDDALAITHRSQEPYKHMRATVAANPIITWPVEGLTQRTPTGIGFLSKSDSTTILDEDTFVCLSEYTTTTFEARAHLLAELEKLSRELEHDAAVLSFWVLKPRDPVVTDSIAVFGRYTSQQHYVASLSAKIKQIESSFQKCYPDESMKTGFWNGAGFGFIRGGQFTVRH